MTDATRAEFEVMASALPFASADRRSNWHGRVSAVACSPLWPEIDSSQPVVFEKFRLVGDVRLDDPDELRYELRCAGTDTSGTCSDAQLILRAYGRWGVECVSRLLGDFSFAICDDNGSIFCARDPFGIKPLFRAPLKGGGWAVSNSIETLRRHPRIGNALDEYAVADFLLFDTPCEPSRTIYSAVERVPAGHYVTVQPGGESRLRRYWQPRFDQVEDRLRIDHVEEFLRLLRLALKSRLPGSGGAILMSGGLDSTALVSVARETNSAASLEAFTVAYDHLVPDDEARFASLAAKHFDIRWSRMPADDFAPFDQYRRFGVRPPEPLHEPDGGIYVDVYREPARRHRVLLTGYDGDALLTDSPKPYIRHALAQGRWLTASAAAAHYALLERRVLPRRWRIRRDLPVARGTLPEWLSPDFASRLRLYERWQDHAKPCPSTASLRPYAEMSLGAQYHHSRFFERFDPAVTGERVECRHPFMDLRLVQFCLTLPPVPWCVRKGLLRRAMTGRLPAAVLNRPKTPMQGTPLMGMLQQARSAWIDAFPYDDRLAGYVQRDKIPPVHRESDLEQAWSNLRPLSLQLWLNQT
jgi:asparagine synthase (glutamine-hydrolysing)